MSRPVAAILLIVGVLTIDRGAQACAGCSNPNLASARAANTALEPRRDVRRPEPVGHDNARGAFRDLSRHRSHLQSAGGTPATSRPAILRQRVSTKIIGVGISKVFGAEIQMPVRLLRTTIIFRRLDGTPFVPDYENIHHRNETLFGLANPWLLGERPYLDKLVFSGRAGVGLPFGSTEEDPFARGRAGLPHEHIQFGTGTFYPVVALDAELVLDDVRLSGYVQSNLFLYENRHGYRAGNRYVSGLSGDLEVVRHFRVGLGGDIVNEQPERWGSHPAGWQRRSDGRACWRYP